MSVATRLRKSFDVVCIIPLEPRPSIQRTVEGLSRSSDTARR
jgi:hypothetical protein